MDPRSYEGETKKEFSYIKLLQADEEMYSTGKEN